MKIGQEELTSRIAALEKELTGLRSLVSKSTYIEEKSYHWLFENSPDGFALCKMIYLDEQPVDFVYLSVNPSFERIIGLKDVENKRFTELFPSLHPMDNEFIKVYGSVARSKTPKKLEKYFSTLECWLSITILCPEKDYFIAIFEDVSDKKKTEQDLIEREARLRAVMESTSEVIGLLDKQGKILDANEAFARLLQKNRNELFGQNVFDLITKEIPEQLKQDAAKVVLSGQPFRGVDCTRSRWLEYVVNPIKINSQSPDHFALFMKDITESKKAVEEMSSSIQRYESLMKTASDGIHVIDQNGKIIEVSDSFCQMLGYSREELLSMKVTEIDDEKDSDEIKKNIDKSFLQPLIFPARHRRKDGSFLEVEVSISAISIGGQTYCYASSRDITERLIAEKALLKSEAQLRELNATKDKFFSIIGHDLRSPFNAILGFSNLMLEQIKTNDYSDIANYAEIIANSTERAVNLLNNLMEWSRSQTGRITFQAEYTDIVPIVRDAVNLLQESANQKSIYISIVSPDYLCSFVDKSMFHTILRNILSNAIKFTCDNGQVDIKVIIVSSEILISVSDNGIGLSQENLNNLFRIEEIYSTPGTQNEKGTGLGLVLCKEFVEKHNGRIWAESTLGKGSTFYFTIPVQ